MKLGYNFMWAFNRYGTYFGPHHGNPILPPEPEWDPADPPEGWSTERIRSKKYEVHDEEYLPQWDTWVEAFAGHMRYLRNNLKVDVVRIFLLCNALNYGTLDQSGIYQPPAYLHPRFRWHFKKILEGAQSGGVQLIPSLIDFGIGHPDWKTVQRAPIVYDRDFYPTIFEPLLEISKAHRSTIYAWEVMNEPFWLNARYWPHRFELKSPSTWLPATPSLPVQPVVDFLNEGIRRIHLSGFESTVGHRFFSDLWKYPTGSIPQFHYYPDSINPANDDPKSIPDALTTGLNAPPILGEFGASEEQGDPWPELDPADANSRSNRVFERLKAARRKNYGLAMIWPDGKGDDRTDQTRDQLKLTPDAEQGVTRYLDHFNLR